MEILSQTSSMMALDIDLLLSHLFKPIITHQKEDTKHRNCGKKTRKQVLLREMSQELSEIVRFPKSLSNKTFTCK